MHESAAIEMEPNGPAQHTLLEGASLADKILNRIAVRDGGNALHDDWTLVEIFGHVVTRRPDQLHAPSMRGMVGFCTRKRRKERMMNIDDPIREGIRHSRTKYLHVASKHHEIDAMLPKQRDLGNFLVFFGVLCDRKMVKWNPETLRDPSEILPIARDERYLHVQFPTFVAGKEIVKAVIVLRYKKGDARGNVREVKLPLHRKTVDERFQTRDNGFSRQRKTGDRPLDPHEENAHLLVHMLIDVYDIPSIFKEESRNGRDDSGLIRAGDQ